MADYKFKNNKNNDDDFNINDDALFDGFDDIFADIDSDPTREAKDAKVDLKKIFSHATNVKTIKGALIDNLFDVKLRGVQDEYVKWKDTVNSQKEVVSESLNNFLSETKQFTKVYGAKVDAYLPEKVKSAKSEFLKLLEKHTEDDSSYSWKPQSEESIREESVSSSLAEIFKEQERVKAVESQQARTESLVDKAIESERFKQSFAVSDKIRLNSDFLTKFTRTVYTAYLKESLKLKYKHLFVSQDILKTVKESSRLNAEYLNRITTNTSLPDIVKQTLIDLGKYKLRQKALGTLSDKLSNYTQGVIQRATNTLTGFLGGAQSLLGIANMFGQFDDGPTDPNKLIGEQIARTIGNSISDKVFNEKTALGSVFRLANKEASTASKKLFLKAGKLESDNIVLDSIYKILKPEGVTGDIEANIGIKDPTAPAYFDSLTKLSITEIIPGYLAKILKQVTEINTGRDTEELVFDAKSSRDFVSVSTMQNKIKEDLFGKEDTKARQLGSVIGTLRGNYLLNSKDRENDEKIFREKDEDLRKLFANFASHREDLDFSIFRRLLKKIDQNVSEGKRPDEGLDDTETYKRLFKGIKDPVAVTKIMIQAIKARNADGDEYFDRLQENEIFNAYVDNLVFTETYDARYNENAVNYGNARFLKNYLTEKDGRYIFNKDTISDIKTQVDNKVYGSTVTFQSRLSADESRTQQIYFQKLPEFFTKLTDILFYDDDRTILKSYLQKVKTISSPKQIYDTIVSSIREFKDKLKFDSNENDDKGFFKRKLDQISELYKDLFIDEDGKFKFDSESISGLISSAKRSAIKKKKAYKEQLKELMKKKNAFEDELAHKASFVDDEVKFSDYEVEDSNVTDTVKSIRDKKSSKRKSKLSRTFIDNSNINIPDIVKFDESTIAKVTKPIIDVLNDIKNSFTKEKEDLSVVDEDHPLQIALQKYDSILSLLKEINDRNAKIAIASTGNVEFGTNEDTDSKFIPSGIRALGRHSLSALKATGNFALSANKAIVNAAKETILGVTNTSFKYGGSVLSGAGKFASGLGTGVGKLAAGLGSGYGATLKGLGTGIGRVFGVGSSEQKYFDVYRKDEVEIGKPLLTRKQQRLGEVVFADGTKLEYTSEIDQPVIEIATKTTLISQEDIEHGLVDVDNKAINSRGFGSSSFGLGSKLISAFKFGTKGAGKLLSVGKNVLLDPYTAAMKLGLSGLGAVGGFGMDLVKRMFGLDTSSSIGQRKMLFEVVGARIDRIYNLLATKFEVPGFEPVDIKDDEKVSNKVVSAGRKIRSIITSKLLNRRKEESESDAEESKEDNTSSSNFFDSLKDELSGTIKRKTYTTKTKAKELSKKAEKLTSGYFRDVEYKEENSPEEGTRTLKKMYKLLEKQDKEKKAEKKKEDTKSLFDTIKDMFGSVFGNIGGTVGGLITKGKGLLTAAGKGIGTVGRNVFGGLKSLATKYGPQLLKGGRFLANSAARFLASPLGMVAAPVATAVGARAFANSDAAKNMFGEKNFNNAHEILNNLDEDTMDPSSMELEDGTPMTFDIEERKEEKKLENERNEKKQAIIDKKYNKEKEDLDKIYKDIEYPTAEKASKLSFSDWSSLKELLIQKEISYAHLDKRYNKTKVSINENAIELKVLKKLQDIAYNYCNFGKRSVKEKNGKLIYTYQFGIDTPSYRDIYNYESDIPPKGIKVDIPSNLANLASQTTNKGSGNIDPKARKEESSKSHSGSDTSSDSSKSSIVNPEFWGSTRKETSISKIADIVSNFTKGIDEESSKSYSGSDTTLANKDMREYADSVKKQKDTDSTSLPHYSNTAELMSGKHNLINNTPNIRFLPKPPPKGKEEVLAIIKAAAIRVGFDPDVAATIANVESSLNPNAKAPTSSAGGLYQFIDSTWKEKYNKYAPKHKLGISPDKFNPIHNAIIGIEFLKENSNALKPILKRDANVVELYMAHFLGINGAKKFFTVYMKDPDALSTVAVSSKVLNANSAIFKTRDGKIRTVKEVYQLLASRLDKKFISIRHIRAAVLNLDSDVGSDTNIANRDIRQSTSNVSYSDPNAGNNETATRTDMSAGTSLDSRASHTNTFTPPKDTSSLGQTPYSNIPSATTSIPSHDATKSIEAMEGEQVIKPTDSDIITSPFGPRNVKGGSKNHRGIDLRARMGDPIYSIADNGVVTVVGGSFGIIEIAYEKLKVRVRYLHLSKFNVRQGDIVKKGQVIGLAGGTGPSGPYQYTPHLHFDVRPYVVRYYDKNTCIDPEKWFKSYGVHLRRKGEAGNSQMTPMSDAGVEEKKTNTTGSIATPSSDNYSPASMMNQTTGTVSTGTTSSISSSSEPTSTDTTKVSSTVTTSSKETGIDRDTKMLNILADIHSGIVKLNETIPTLDSKPILTSIKDLMKTSNEYLKNGFNSYSSSSSSPSTNRSSSSSTVSTPKMPKNKVSVAKV